MSTERGHKCLRRTQKWFHLPRMCRSADCLAYDEQCAYQRISEQDGTGEALGRAMVESGRKLWGSTNGDFRLSSLNSSAKRNIFF